MKEMLRPVTEVTMSLLQLQCSCFFLINWDVRLEC